jgi:uncharacterized FlgJ-related protein
MKINELLIENQQAQFVQQNYGAAKEVGDQLGVDPKLVLGHWALETGWGKSVIPGTNNLGNIKDFSGGGIKAYDKVEKSNDAYIVYDSPEASATAYADLLKRRFPGVIGAGSDQEAFVQGLQGGKFKYAGTDFAKVYAGMPASVEKYLNPDNKWSMDPSKLVAKIKSAPDEVKKYITANFPSVKAFVEPLTTNKDKESEETELIINGKKKKFKNKQEAEKAIKLAQQLGHDVQST